MGRRGSGVPTRRAHSSLAIAGIDILAYKDERPSSGGEAEHLFSPSAMQSSLPEIKHRPPPATQKPKQGLLDYIYTETYGGVEFYKKLAKRAESAMQLEQKHFQSDLERSHEMIQRLKNRISALEIASEEREVTVAAQRRKIKALRHQLHYSSQEFDRELSYMRAQGEYSERRLAVGMQESKRMIMELRRELEDKKGECEALQNDVNEMLKCIEEPLETFYLPDYFGDSRSSSIKRTEGIKNAAKILRIRILHDDLIKETKQKSDESSSLLEELRSLKGARDAAQASLKAFEGVESKVEALGRSLSQSALLKAAGLPALEVRSVATILDRLQPAVQLLVSKADSLNQTSAALENQRQRLGHLINQLVEDVGLRKADQGEDFASQLTSVKEQIRMKIQQLKILQKEKADAQALASKRGDVEKSLEELNQRFRNLQSERDKLAQIVSEEQKVRSSIQEKLLNLQAFFKELSTSLQAGKYEAIPTIRSSDPVSSFDERQEADKLITTFKSLSTEKNQLEGRIHKSRDNLAELKKENEVLTGKLKKAEADMVEAEMKLKQAEAQVGEVEKKSASQVDSTMQQASDACDTLRGTLLKLQPLFGEAEALKEPKFSASELAEVSAAYTKIAPKVVDLKNDRDLLVDKLSEATSKLSEATSKLSEATSKLSETRSKLSEAEKIKTEDREVTQQQLHAVRQGLKALQSLFPAELGKGYNGSEAEDVSLIDKIKQELSSSRETKEKAMGKAQSLRQEVSQLDPMLTDVLKAIAVTEQELGVTPVPFKASGQDTISKVAFIRERLTDLNGILSSKLKTMAEVVSSQKEKTELLDGVLKNAEKKANDRLDLLKREIRRLGGYDIENKQERVKRIQAAEKIKAFVSRVSKPLDNSVNPLSKLATFEVSLLVNNKPDRQLEVSGNMGGLYLASIHYFLIDRETGEITFENGIVPGSQSSNMLVELVLNPSGHPEIYEAKDGDVLGLCIKVKTLDAPDAREVLYNSNVINTDEVMGAIKGQTIDNFSLWPDLLSSWKWERSQPKGWTLTCIKWRFLLKSVFPEMSEPFQVLAISNRPAYDRTQTIRTLFS